LVDPLDPQSIRSGILKVIEDRDYGERLIELGRANITRFLPSAVGKQYEELYDEIVEQLETGNR
jgi:glycosyltransferase involved in cell wall biosynthesis